MNQLTSERETVAAIVARQLGDWHVYPSPPSGITVPCAVVASSARGFERVGYGRWDVSYEVWLYAMGADEGAQQQLEAATVELLAVFPSSVEGRSPSAIQYGGKAYIGSSLDVRRTIVVPPVPEPDVGAPPAPTGLTALATPGQLAVSLQWDDPEAADLAGYHVHRNGEQLTVDHLDPVHNYSDVGGDLAYGVEYAYTVTAVDFAGNESDHSTPATITLTP